jgi:CubicO group peptidase (beta-lactamase class C family)
MDKMRASAAYAAAVAVTVAIHSLSAHSGAALAQSTGISAPSTATGLPAAAPNAVGLDAARLHEATDLLNRYVAERKIAGAVAAVARQGRVAYMQAVGVQDIETRSPMTERSLFRIYSMTKPVTAVAAMILYEEGRFQLTDAVSKYLPEFDEVQLRDAATGELRRPVRPLTIEDLLLHTSGLNHRTSDVYRQAAVRSRSIALPQFIRNIVRVPLMEDPGTRFRYSESTTVVGRLIEIWSGVPLDLFLERRVLQPLGMRDTSFQVTPEQKSRLTTVYAPAAGGGLTPIELETLPFTERPVLLEGAVGLVSTVPDYVRFSTMLLNRGTIDGVRLLRADTVDMMTVNRLSPSVLAARGGGRMGWGLANVDVLMNPGETNPANKGEYGWDGTAGTIFWVDPTSSTVTVLMTQVSPPNPDSLRQRFKAIVQGSLIK